MSDMKTIWHKLPEQPENGRDVLEKWNYLGIHYTHFVAKNGIAEENPFTDAWCYLDDLLSCEQELERTRKALDVAIHRLNQIAEHDCDQGCMYVAQNALEQITALTKGGNNE